MKAATVKEIKSELSTLSHKEIVDICVRLSRFKKENKELLTYLLFESSNEAAYIENIKMEMDEQFEQINRKSYFYIKKSIRKILRRIKTYIRYTKNKETEVEVLIYFCYKLENMTPSIQHNTVLKNIYTRQIKMIKKIVASLDEDLQHDYGLELEELRFYN